LGAEAAALMLYQSVTSQWTVDQITLDDFWANNFINILQVANNMLQTCDRKFRFSQKLFI